MLIPLRRGVITLASVALALFAAPGLAQQSAPGLIPVERFFQRPAVLDAKLSPTGRYAAVTTSRGSDRIGLVVYEFASGKPGRRVAQFVDADVTSFAWVGDERLVFRVHDLQAGSGEDQREGPGLFAVNADGQKMAQLIQRRGSPFLRGGINMRQALDPSHILLHVPMQQEGVQPNEVVIGQRVLDSDNVLHSILPMWLDTATGRIRPLEQHKPPTGIFQWMFDSKGQPRLALTRKADTVTVHWLGPGETQWRPISQGSSRALPFVPYAVDDGGTLYGTHTEGREGLAVLNRFDFSTMKPEADPLVRTEGFDFRGQLVLDRAGSRALGVHVHADIEQTHWWDPAMKAFQAAVDKKFAGRVNRISCVRCGQPDMLALVRSYTDRDPGTLLIYERAAQRWSSVGDILEGMEPARMAHVGIQRIRARDGRELPVWLTLPPPAEGEPERALPAVVLVHGGPWLRQGFWQWEATAQFLASRGYLVIAPEFRGSTGYGVSHYRAGWKQWGQAMQDDVADALLWAQEQGLAEKGRACIAGASYGGYATLMGLVRHPELYRCGIASVAVADLPLFVEGSWWVDDDISNDARQYSLAETVGQGDKDRALLLAHSPVHQAARITAPLLLGFGEADRRVPLAHGKRLRDALTDAGRPPEWVTYENEGHSWRMTATQVDWAKRMEKFLARHLGEPRAGRP